MSLVCLSFALLFGTLNLTTVPVPGFNESFLGAHAFNLTCTDVVFHSSGAEWITNHSVTTFTSGGSLHCHANFTAYAYTGLVHADIVVEPSNVTLVPVLAGLKDKVDYCFLGEYAVDTCTANASVTQLYADPPSRLIDLLLHKIRSLVNERLQAYVCKTIVPRVQHDMANQSRPFPPERDTSALKPIFPLSDSRLVRAAANVFTAVAFSGSAPENEGLNRSFLMEESAFVYFLVPSQYHHITRSLVTASPNVSAIDWLQGVVDDVVSGTVPQPFPLFRFPGVLTNATLDLYVPNKRESDSYHLGGIRVDATMASCDANACELYLDPGVAIAQVFVFHRDSVGLLVSNSLMPHVLPAVNAKINDALRAIAQAQGRNASDPNATVKLSFGKKAVLRRAPKVWPLVCIVVCAAVFGVWAVRRNLRRHALEPVLNCATGTSVSTARLIAEDTFMVVAATVCLVLFAASNMMTGASVLLGEELNTYSFSMWNTVADLWRAGLLPLSVCVFVFSGVYPYLKLLSLVYFTVVLQRPLSKRLALIDVLGKFSFIDTFALIVMVSGLEIRGVAQVVIHLGFYFFLFATAVSIALGNYATTLYRRGTSHRVPNDDGEAAVAAGRGSSGGNVGYTQVATSDNGSTSSTASPPLLESTVAHHTAAAAQVTQYTPSGPLQNVQWRRACASALPFLVVQLCSLPAWMCGCLQYDIGGLARLLTPSQKTLTLWQLSCLNKWNDKALLSEGGVVCILLTALTTVLLAPCLFALLSKRSAFLASWCAADVFVVACAAGLLQLHQFVTFVLGDGMDEVYAARATLQWPMLPLAVASFTVWYLTICDVLCGAWPQK